MTTQRIAQSLALAFAVTACAADAPTDPTDLDGDGLPDGGGEEETRPTDASGRYTMRSNLDLAQNAPGTAGEVVRAFIDATDDGDDPTSWVLDQAINAMEDGTFKNWVRNAKPYVAGYLNDRLLEWAPDLLSTLVGVGDDFGQMATSFGLNERLDIAPSADGYIATRTIIGTHFKIDSLESDHLFTEAGGREIVASGIAVTLDPTGKLSLGEHQVDLSYGKILRVGLDGVVIPQFEANARSIQDLLHAKVDCWLVGIFIKEAVESYFGYGGSASFYENACNDGIEKAAEYIYNKIESIDATALELKAAGVSKALDTNGDGKADKIQTGAWTGTTSYGGAVAPLTDARFYGARD